MYYIFLYGDVCLCVLCRVTSLWYCVASLCGCSIDTQLVYIHTHTPPPVMTLVVILGGDALFFVVPCSMHGIVHVSISTLEIAKRALLDHYGELRLMFG